MLRLPEGMPFSPELTDNGLLRHLQFDLGQVISAQLRTLYPNRAWSRSYNNRPPTISAHELLVEYTAHPDARF